MNYGAGKSKFYTSIDSVSHANVSKLSAPSTKKDQTLYLSNSTFYNDTQESKPESWSNTDICWSDVGAETKFKLPYDNKFCQTKNK
ncbi:uncharacterized protein LOC106636947 isoform X3 [Copidosoma floridanum]|uniref:uncharacterized protein LOC106636947 isoform X3 n=1 Tax=Copidosoma floridanum TaxID=29053 RepID=UPI0006C98DB0|nr:uncharacterized protein LOC106636947 isoform X3 [Copidosoma floridanum]